MPRTATIPTPLMQASLDLVVKLSVQEEVEGVEKEVEDVVESIKKR